MKDLIAAQSPFRSRLQQQPGFVNIDNAEIYGFEIEVAYDADYVFANASYSYVVGKEQGHRRLSYDGRAARTGVHARRQGAGLRPQVRVDSPHRRRPAGSCRRSDTAVSCPPAPIAASTRYSEAFDVHDIFLTWKPEDGQFAGWEAELGVDNMFDQQYKEFLINDDAKGRTFKVSLAKQFGW